ncbi:hypothetical protein GGS20DRAFT_508138 [Poronia punctata]|nr:hypothetical protein GGS20DRAFT_508138 [Poronia punctata]
MNPPSIPPPPPPPPPLNIPPSRARLQLAARLAMHQKNNAAASAQSTSENGGERDDTRQGQAMGGGLRNPFEDDGDDDIDDDSDDGLGGPADDSNDWVARSSRGGWWRSTLRRAPERFGDGRDDSDSDRDDQGEGEEEEDDEFGDFAMPETDKDNAQSGTGVIVKPLPVHPPPHNPKSSPFTSLWPFGSKEKPKGDEPVVETAGEVTEERDERIKTTHEAARRTSIEDPDDDEVVV